MQILHAELLVKHSSNMYKDFYVPDVIHVIMYIMRLGYKPNIDLELNKAFFQEFLQYKRMTVQEPLLKCVTIKNIFR
jgi:hypothetical protein